MHPPIEDLLAIRDGDASAALRAHVAGCAACAAEVERLAGTRDALRALPPIEPPAGSLDRLLAARAAARRKSRWRHSGGLALAASVVMAVALLALPRGGIETPATVVPVAVDPEVDALLARSHDLDRALAAFTADIRVLDLRTAGTIASLEDRIAQVDAYLLHTETLAPQTAVDLLRRRVLLAQALVDVHAANPRNSL